MEFHHPSKIKALNNSMYLFCEQIRKMLRTTCLMIVDVPSPIRTKEALRNKLNKFRDLVGVLE